MSITERARGILGDLLFAACVALLAALHFGCGGQTMAEEGAAVGDLTSCGRTQWPVPCLVEVACSRPVEDCISVGCLVEGSGLRMYPDGSWSDGAEGLGSWSVAAVAPGLKAIRLGNRAPFVVEDDGRISCP